jgi:hypothetical protein
MEFKDFLEMSSLKNIIGGIPQHPKHHPEGDVFTHTRMVRYSLDDALNILKQAQQEPNSSLKNIDFNLSEEEKTILKVAAWMHDIGKATATTYTPEKGYQAIGHQESEHFIPNMRKLKGSLWEKIWNKASMLAKKDIYFLIKHHMSLRDQSGKIGFGKRRGNMFVDEKGQYINKTPIKLLLVLILMDRLGRKVEDPEASAWKAIKAFDATAQEKKRRSQPGFGGGQAAPDDPVAFLKQLSGKPPQVINMAFKGKFQRSPSKEELELANNNT